MGYLYVLVKGRMICQFCWPKVGAHKLKVLIRYQTDLNKICSLTIVEDERGNVNL